MNTLKNLMILAVSAVVVSCGQNSNSTDNEAPAPKVPVVTVMSYDEDHLPLEKTTGVFIEPNKLVTVDRLAQGAHTVEYKLEGDSAYRTDAQIVSYSKSAGLAILQTESAHEPSAIDSSYVADSIPVCQLSSYGSAGMPILNEKGAIIGLSDVHFRAGQLLFNSVSLKGLSECEPFKAGSVRVVPPACLRLDSVIVTSNYNPCECKVGVLNYSKIFIQGIEGMILFYDKDNVMYDMMNYKKSASIRPEGVTIISILVGDERIHPGQYWNNPERITYTKGVSKTGSRHNKTSQSSDWLKCRAQSLEFRFLDFKFISDEMK